MLFRDGYRESQMDNPTRDVLFIFNLSFDPDNEILAHSIDWANEFTSHFSKLYIFTMQGNSLKNKSSKITVKLLKAKNSESIIKVCLRTISSLRTIYKNRKRSCVFFHMNHKPIPIVAPFLRLWGVPSGLWYSHKHSSFLLKVSEKLVNIVVSSTTESFPLHSKKLLVTGHAISPVFITQEFEVVKKSGIVHLGRVAPVKRIENIVFALAALPREFRKLDLIGGTPDLHYKEFLKEIGSEMDVSLNFIGSKGKADVAKRLCHYGICFSGTEKSVDKAPLEAASLGCYIVSNNKGLMELSGMKLVMNKNLNIDSRNYSLQQLLESLLIENSFDHAKARRLISDTVRALNSLNFTVEQISKALIKGEPDLA